MTGSVRFRSVDYKGWESLQIEHGHLALMLVPQVGGRIMGMQWRGNELAFVNPALQGRVENLAAVADVRECKPRLGFPLWGGDKTWLAPQSNWADEVPFVDLDSGAYELAVDATRRIARMTSPVCRESGVQIVRTIRMGAEPGNWTVSHTLHNRSATEVSWAPWDVAMINRPATVYLPTNEASRFPQGVKTFDNEGVSAAVREDVLESGDGHAVIQCREAIKFKYGVDAGVGTVLAVLEPSSGGFVGLRKSVPVYAGQSYAHGCVAEVFNSGELPYLELELHGPVTALAPGASFTLEESVEIFDMHAIPGDAGSISEWLGT